VTFATWSAVGPNCAFTWSGVRYRPWFGLFGSAAARAAAANPEGFCPVRKTLVVIV